MSESAYELLLAAMQAAGEGGDGRRRLSELLQLEGAAILQDAVALRALLEASITGRLEHPGVVPIHGLGFDDSGRPHMAMRLIRGQPLSSLLVESPLAELLEILLKVMDTVAYAHAELGQPEQALADLTEAIRLAPTDANLYVNRANAYAAMADHRAAVADYTSALELQPGSLRVVRLRATSCLMLGDFAAAAADLTVLIERGEGGAEALFERGMSLRELGQNERAAADLRAFLQAAPDHPMADRVRRVLAELEP